MKDLDKSISDTDTPSKVKIKSPIKSVRHVIMIIITGWDFSIQYKYLLLQTSKVLTESQVKS